MSRYRFSASEGDDPMREVNRRVVFECDKDTMPLREIEDFLRGAGFSWIKPDSLMLADGETCRHAKLSLGMGAPTISCEVCDVKWRQVVSGVFEQFRSET